MGNIKGIHPENQHILRLPVLPVTAKDGLTPSILQSPSLGDHSILLCSSPVHMVYIPRVVNLPSQRSSLISSLLSSEDMEVIVRRMSSSMTLRSNSRTENDQIPIISPALPYHFGNNSLSDRGVNDVHTSHSSCGIVEDPFGSILKVDLETSVGVGSSKLLHQSSDNSSSIVRLGSMLL